LISSQTLSVQEFEKHQSEKGKKRVQSDGEHLSSRSGKNLGKSSGKTQKIMIKEEIDEDNTAESERETV
jgi:hypothetical protein